MKKDLILSLLFMLVTGALILATATLFGNPKFGEFNNYRAIFTDTTGLDAGSDVRAAGVDVGRVESLELQNDGKVLVEFSVNKSVNLTSGTSARIRYADLIGGRYLSLANPVNSPASVLPVGATIGSTKTKPSLDLDELFNGFAPLMQGLNPGQINELSRNLIAVFEGQGGNINNLMLTVAKLTNGLADKDQVITEVIVNLSKAMRLVNNHRGDFNKLVINARKVVSGLSADRGQISQALGSLQSLVSSGNQFLAEVRGPLRTGLPQVRRVAQAINSDAQKVDLYLRLFPKVLHTLGRTGSYGTFYNMYICGITFTLDSPLGGEFRGPVIYDRESKRCQYPEGVNP